MAMVFQVKLAHVPEVLHRKTRDPGKLPPQVSGQVLHDGPTPSRPFLSAGDHPPDIPVQPDQLGIDRFQGGILRRTDPRFHFMDKLGVVLVLMVRFHFTHASPPSTRGV
jgi:hypothetical protein